MPGERENAEYIVAIVIGSPIRVAILTDNLQHFIICREKLAGRSMSPEGVRHIPTKKFVLLRSAKSPFTLLLQ